MLLAEILECLHVAHPLLWQARKNKTRRLRAGSYIKRISAGSNNRTAARRNFVRRKSDTDLFPCLEFWWKAADQVIYLQMPIAFGVPRLQPLRELMFASCSRTRVDSFKVALKFPQDFGCPYGLTPAFSNFSFL